MSNPEDYNKFRPHIWSKVHGQNRAVSFLKKCIKNSFIPNFIIFTGTYGIGKTTIARIFTKSSNCLNLNKDLDACNTCAACKNYSYCTREYNSSNYTRLDDIRELIEDAKIQSIFSKYKFYIFDEFQMLSTNLFNIMLKTVEEPPSKNARFIAITNNINMIPDNLVSRSICIKFEDAKQEEVKNIILDIKKEFPEKNITYDKAEYKSYRDVINNIISNSIDLTFGTTSSKIDLYKMAAYTDTPIDKVLAVVKDYLNRDSQENILYSMLHTVVHDYLIRSIDKEKSYKNCYMLLKHIKNIDKNNLSIVVCISQLIDSR